MNKAIFGAVVGALALLVVACTGDATALPTSTPDQGAAGEDIATPTPGGDLPTPTRTPAVVKKDTGEQGEGVLVECEATVQLSLENPILVARGVDPIPSGFDAANSAGCKFVAPISKVTLELDRGENIVFAREIIVNPPETIVGFPLPEEEIDAIPSDIELGSYERLIKVTSVDGAVSEVRPAAHSVWLLDPASSPKDKARDALVAARQRLVESQAIPYAGPSLVAFEPVEWSDASLGCPEPGKMYAQVITPGFRLVFDYQGQRYEYHTDQAGTALECEIEPGPSTGLAPDDTPQEIAQSQAQRDPSPDVSQASLSELTDANTAFAFDLYQALREDDGNLFFSPFSISAALAMPYAGARDETERQMAETLHFSLPQQRLHAAFNALDQELNDPDSSQAEDDFELRVANSLWGQIDFEIKAEFLDLIATNYGAGLRLVDFIDPVNREQARMAINQWASDQTEGKIEGLIPDRILTELTRLVLANAIYFNAKWEAPFLGGTEDDEFSLPDGQRVTVQMMSRRGPTGYAQGQGYQAVELAYKGGSAQMIVLLPDQGRFEEIEGLMSKDMMEEILLTFASTDVKLFMPRFEYEARLGLADTLAGMGMPDAFDTQRADFTGIVVNPTPRLYIKDVLHKAFVAVDEIGTEAAAVTAVVMEIESMPTVVKIDRPFIFIIRDSENDTVLFVGRVLDPTA